MKVVINRCYGGFSLSKEAYDYMGIPYEEDWGGIWPKEGYSDPERNDPKLVECVEVLGDKANGTYAKLRVVDIPDGISWYIDDYDGMERIEEEHSSWY